jgi:hypothetical protein
VQELDVMEGDPALAEQAGKRCVSPRMRLTIMFALSEVVVIVSALSYSFFLFRLYAGLKSDVFKVISESRRLLTGRYLEITTANTVLTTDRLFGVSCFILCGLSLP